MSEIKGKILGQIAGTMMRGGKGKKFRQKKVTCGGNVDK